MRVYEIITERIVALLEAGPYRGIELGTFKRVSLRIWPAGSTTEVSTSFFCTLSVTSRRIS